MEIAPVALDESFNVSEQQIAVKSGQPPSFTRPLCPLSTTEGCPVMYVKLVVDWAVFHCT